MSEYHLIMHINFSYQFLIKLSLRNPFKFFLKAIINLMITSVPKIAKPHSLLLWYIFKSGNCLRNNCIHLHICIYACMIRHLKPALMTNFCTSMLRHMESTMCQETAISWSRIRTVLLYLRRMWCKHFSILSQLLIICFPNVLWFQDQLIFQPTQRVRTFMASWGQ